MPGSSLQDPRFWKSEFGVSLAVTLSLVVVVVLPINMLTVLRERRTSRQER